MNEYEIRTMTQDELSIAIDWAAQEGWNPGVGDLESFYRADPNGFLIGLLDGQPVATISAVKYGKSFGFMGFYIVAPAYRGQGYGLKIWNAALDYLAGRNIGLDGVVEQQDNYRKSGFKLAYRNIRYEGIGDGKSGDCQEIVPLSELPMDAILAYDQPFFPDDRTAFLKAWLRQKDSTALGYVEAGKLAGYGVLRACRSGFKVGPLFADRPSIAKALLDALKSKVPRGAPFYLDPPEVNPAAVALAKDNGMRVVFETARMYSGAIPELPLDRTFGVTSFELG